MGSPAAGADAEGGIALGMMAVAVAVVAAVRGSEPQRQRESLDRIDRVVHETEAAGEGVLLDRVVRKSDLDLDRSQAWIRTSSWNVLDVLVAQGSFPVQRAFQGYRMGRSE